MNALANTDKAPKFRDLQSIMKDPAAKAKLTNLVDEAVILKHKIYLHQQTIKQLRETAKDDLQLNPKLFNANVNASFNNDFVARREGAAEIVDLMDNLIGLLPADNSNFQESDE